MNRKQVLKSIKSAGFSESGFVKWLFHTRRKAFNQGWEIRDRQAKLECNYQICECQRDKEWP